jgi:hypothetical protein
MTCRIHVRFDLFFIFCREDELRNKIERKDNNLVYFNLMMIVVQIQGVVEEVVKNTAH